MIDAHGNVLHNDFKEIAGNALTRPARRGIFPVLRESNAAAAGLRAGVIPGSGVKSKHVLCLEILGVSVKHWTNHPVQGVDSTDRERPFYFRPGESPMSLINSNVAAVELSGRFDREIKTGTITLPEIIPAKVPVSQGRGTPQRQNTRYILTAADNAAARAKRAALRAAGLDHPDTVEMAGRVYDLRTMPDYRRVYFERLARIKTAPMAAVLLKCFECSGYSAPESRGCNCRDCALWGLRHHRAARKQEAATTGEE